MTGWSIPMSNDNISENSNERGGSGSNNSHRPTNPPKSEQQSQEPPRPNKQPQPGDTDDKSGRQPQGSPG
jgi:hypothetical protein